jgi:hypothetical protein
MLPFLAGSWRRSRLRLVPDKPVKSVTIDDLAIRSTPRLRGKGVNYLAAKREFVEPIVENCWFGCPQQRQHEAFEPNALLSCCRIRPGQSDNTVEHSVSYGLWRAVAAAEVLIGVQGKLTVENVCVEAECFTRRSRETDIDLRCRHEHMIRNRTSALSKFLGLRRPLCL